MEKTLASVLESTPVHGDSPARCGAVKLRPPEVSKRFLIPSKSKKNASLRAPAKNVISRRVAMFGVSPNDTGDVGEDLLADGLGRSGVARRARIHVDGLLAVLSAGEHVAERDVVQTGPRRCRPRGGKSRQGAGRRPAGWR